MTGINNFNKVVLKNGLTILHEKRNLFVTSVAVVVKTGALYETMENKGIAHFTEHLTFQGTQKRSQKEIAIEIEKAGGDLNGYTAEEATCFYCKIPKNKFETSFDVLSDMIQNPVFDKKEFVKEKKVIIEEINLKHDNPKYQLFDKIKELLYKKPFALSILGTKKTIKNMTIQKVLDFHKLYCPKNIIVCSVGNVNFEHLVEITKEKFKDKPEKVLPKVELFKINKFEIEKRSYMNQTHIALGFHAAPLASKEKYAFELFNTILGKGMSSRLFQEIREKRKIAYEILSFIDQEKSYGHLVVYAGIDKTKLKLTKEIILKEIRKISLLQKKELEETKEQSIGNWELFCENSMNVVNNLLFNEISTRAEDFYDFPEKISQVKLEDVRKIAKLKGYSFAAIVPR